MQREASAIIQCSGAAGQFFIALAHDARVFQKRLRLRNALALPQQPGDELVRRHVVNPPARDSA